MHFNSIAGAVDVPSLQATDLDTYGYASITAMYPPRGALALVTAAVCIVYFDVSILY